jgi:hypothetical protein
MLLVKDVAVAVAVVRVIKWVMLKAVVVAVVMAVAAGLQLLRL